MTLRDKTKEEQEAKCVTTIANNITQKSSDQKKRMKPHTHAHAQTHAHTPPRKRKKDHRPHTKPSFGGNRLLLCACVCVHWLMDRTTRNARNKQGEGEQRTGRTKGMEREEGGGKQKGERGAHVFARSFCEEGG